MNINQGNADMKLTDTKPAVHLSIGLYSRVVHSQLSAVTMHLPQCHHRYSQTSLHIIEVFEHPSLHLPSSMRSFHRKSKPPPQGRTRA